MAGFGSSWGGAGGAPGAGAYWAEARPCCGNDRAAPHRALGWACLALTRAARQWAAREVCRFGGVRCAAAPAGGGAPRGLKSPRPPRPTPDGAGRSEQLDGLAAAGAVRLCACVGARSIKRPPPPASAASFQDPAGLRCLALLPPPSSPPRCVRARVGARPGATAHLLPTPSTSGDPAALNCFPPHPPRLCKGSKGEICVSLLPLFRGSRR